jgi:KDO2-lipid IV(A) lauroyltransferase
MRADSESLSTRWHAGSLNNGFIFGATFHLVSRLPRSWSYGIGHVGTWLAYHLIRTGTAALIENLRVVRPDANDDELRRLALLVYRCYARDTIDFIRSVEMDRARLEQMILTVDGQRIEDALRQGRGVIIVGGHFGNWELGGVALRRLHGYPLTIVAKAESSPAVGEIRRRLRESLSIETVVIGEMLETALRISSILRSNGVVAMLLDRHVGRDRTTIEFFGRETDFIRTPAMIGLLSGAPLLPAFMIRQSDGRFRGEWGEPIVVDRSRPTDEAVLEATQAFAAQLETRIREHPELWYQFYPFWSGKPQT